MQLWEITEKSCLPCNQYPPVVTSWKLARISRDTDTDTAKTLNTSIHPMPSPGCLYSHFHSPSDPRNHPCTGSISKILRQNSTELGTTRWLRQLKGQRCTQSTGEEDFRWILEEDFRWILNSWELWCWTWKQHQEAEHQGVTWEIRIKIANVRMSDSIWPLKFKAEKIILRNHVKNIKKKKKKKRQEISTKAF